MRWLSIVSLPVLSVLALFGCGEEPAAPGAAGGAGAPHPEESALKAARSLTDDKLARLAVYEREMIPSIALASQLAGKSAKSGGGFSGMEKALIAHCQEHLIRWSCPREIEFRKDLPCTLVGKVAFNVLEVEEIAKLKAEGKYCGQ